jgi:hypothetical protein
MLTRRIDSAIESLWTCRERLPFLRELYRPGSPERAALDDVLAAIRRADQVLLGQGASPPVDHTRSIRAL